MPNQDDVEQVDAVLREILAGLAETTADIDLKQWILEFLITMPPLKEWWPAPALDSLRQACAFVEGVDPIDRELEELLGPDKLGPRLISTAGGQDVGGSRPGS